MQRFYKLITYLFFPGNMALLGLICIFQLQTAPIHLPFLAWMVFCFVILPLGGIALLIKMGIVDDLEVFKREQRFKAYGFAIAGAAIAICVAFLYKSDLTEYTWIFIWLLSIKSALWILWLLTQNWMKISAHMTGTAGFLAFCTSISIFHHFNGLWLAVAVIINALVYQSRRGLSAHSHKELIAGFCLGFIVTFALTLIL